MHRTEKSNENVFIVTLKIIGMSGELQRKLDQDERRSVQEVWTKRTQGRETIRWPKQERWGLSIPTWPNWQRALLDHSCSKGKTWQEKGRLLNSAYSGMHKYLKGAQLEFKKDSEHCSWLHVCSPTDVQPGTEQMSGWSVSLPELRTGFWSRIWSALIGIIFFLSFILKMDFFSNNVFCLWFHLAQPLPAAPCLFLCKFTPFLSLIRKQTGI